MNDEQLPHEAARQAIRAGKLPSRPPDRTWGGAGSGCPCAICGHPVTPDEVEIELEFATESGRSDHGFHVHQRCLSAWELELERLQQAPPLTGRSAPRSAGRALPTALPAGTIARRGRTDRHQREREEFRD